MINNINYNKKLSTFLIISSLLFSVSSFADTDSNGNTVSDTYKATSTASGYRNTVNGSTSTAVGSGNEVKGNGSTALGRANEVNGANSTGLGYGNQVNGNFSTSIGAYNNVIGDNNFAFGNGIEFNNGVNNSVGLGNSSKVTESNVVSVGSEKNRRRITNVEDAKNDHDAVTYKQLKEYVKGNGGTSVNVDEKINKLDSNLSGAVAQSMAMANIPQVGDNKLFSIGVGGAYYNKQGGFAVGISGTESSNTFIYKISAGVDTKKQWSIGAGFNINFGNNKKANKCCDLTTTNKSKLEKTYKEQITSLQKENNEIKELLKDLLNKRSSK